MNIFPYPTIINYPAQQFDFKSVVERIFDCTDLSLLHEQLDKEYEKFDEFTDQSTQFHDKFYKEMNKEFLPSTINFS